MPWVVKLLDERVQAELDELPDDMRARFRHIVKLIQDLGLHNIGEPHVKHIEADLWEMRMTGRDGISRALYVAERNSTIVVLRVFVKKTQKTPRREIKTALQRRREIP